MTEAASVQPARGSFAKRTNKKQAWVETVQFALSEAVRFQNLMAEAVRSKQLQSLPKDDLLYGLRRSDGHEWIYGHEADRRVFKLAVDALRQARLASVASPDRMYKALKSMIVERFITERCEVALPAVEKAVAAAVRIVREELASSRHLIPCQLMFVADPDQFSIGPVTFHNRIAFRAIADELVDQHRKVASTKGRKSTAEDVLTYFANFTWVADVTIKGCDQEIGEQRAAQAVNAALDFLHLLFGHYHSRKMVVGGPGLEVDRRGTLEVRNGETRISYLVDSTSAVGFDKGWSEMLDRFGSRQLVDSAGRAIEAIADPAVKRPLAIRFINAASWHGQAVREASPAAAIIKSVTALENLVSTEKSDETTRIVSERSAAMSFDPAGDERLEALTKKMRDIYDLRSRLVHGRLSPFDPEVRTRRSEVLAAVEKSLINGLALLDQDGLLDQSLPKTQLSSGLDGLVAWARRIDLDRHRDVGGGEVENDPK